LGADLFSQFGQADAGRLGCFIDTVGNAFGHWAILSLALAVVLVTVLGVQWRKN
jgi:hypothetical protein